MTGHLLLTISWALGLMPSAGLLVAYIWRVGWPGKDNPGGRAVVALTSVLTMTYLLTVVALVAPSLFNGGLGVTFKVCARLAVAAVIWNLLRLFVRAQRAGRRRQSIDWKDLP